jgi:hypothetical protein
MRMKVDEEEKRAKYGKWELSGCRETRAEGATADLEGSDICKE